MSDVKVPKWVRLKEDETPLWHGVASIRSLLIYLLPFFALLPLPALDGIYLIFLIGMFASAKLFPVYEYLVTDKRIYIRKGRLSKKYRTVYLDHIKSIEIEQGLFGRLFNYGNLRLDLSGRDYEDDTLKMFNIAKPFEVKALIEEAMEDGD